MGSDPHMLRRYGSPSARPLARAPVFRFQEDEARPNRLAFKSRSSFTE